MNAVIYARYSSHGQTEQSIEGQLRDGHQWAEQQGVTVIGEYIDRALTGTKDQRPDFQRMISDAQKKQFQLVIVWKLDRFARNRYDSAIYKARLKKYGVRVVSVKEAISDTPEGIILEGLLESMAEYYSANLSQNIRRGQRESVAHGTWCGGAVPYGYKAVDKKLVIDERTAPVVREVFTSYASGVPMKKIVDSLNARGLKTRAGAAFTINSFHRLLPNPAYTGNYTYSGKVIPGLAERIISDETFAAVQERIRLTAKAPSASKAKTEYLLQGKVFCGHCGAPMIGESGKSKTGAVYHYYTCAVRKKSHSCAKKNERKDFLEWYLVDQTLRYILTPERAARVAAAVVAEYRKEFSDSRVSSLERTIAQLDRDLDKLVDALIDTPKAAHPRIHARMEALEAERADLQADLARLRVASGIPLTEPEVLAWLKQFCAGDPLDPDFCRRIIDVFINSVYVYDDRVIVFYNIKGGKQVSYSDLLSADIPPDIPPDSSACSDLNAYAPPKAVKSEPVTGSDLLRSGPFYVFVNGVFGCVYPRASCKDPFNR